MDVTDVPSDKFLAAEGTPTYSALKGLLARVVTDVVGEHVLTCVSGRAQLTLVQSLACVSTNVPA